MSSSFEFHETANCLNVWLNSAQTGNALTLESLTELLEKVRLTSAPALLVRQKGSVFCAGGNLPFYKKLKSKQEGLEVNEKIRAGLAELDQAPMLKVCLVDGLCVGGGVELISCFDSIWATPRALFGLWQRRIGLTYGWGGEERLLQRVSAQQLRQWRLHATTYSAYQARTVGLVDQVVSWQQGEHQVQAWLEQTIQVSPHSLTSHLDENKSVAQVFSELWLGPDHQAALTRFPK